MAEYPRASLSQVLRQDVNYVSALESRLYPKLSVKLYGRGAVLDAPTDGTSIKMTRHQFAKSGQVIVSEIWAKKGAIGIVPSEGEGALVTSHFFLFDIDQTQVLPGYINWLLKGNFFAEALDAEAHGTTGYAATRPKQFLSLEIPLPPLPEQQRIVARIEAIARRVEEARGFRQKAVEEAGALMGIASSQTFEDGVEQNSIAPIGETFTFRNDLIRPTDGKIGNLRFIGLQHIESHTGRRIGEDHLQAEELTGRKFKFSPGQIVYGYLRPYLNKVWVADCDGYCSVDQYVLKPKQNVIEIGYLAHFMRSAAFLHQAIDLTHNLLLPRLRTALLESIPIPLPPLPEQRHIVGYLDGLQAKVDELKRLQSQTQKELDALMPSVLAKAFAGEL